jgi:hypothetical protein
MRILSTLAAALVLGLAVTSSSHAFGISGFGGKAGYVAPEDLDGTLTLGAHMELEKSGSRLHLLPSIMFWSTADLTNVNPNFDLYYHFSSEGVISPYIGTGLGLHVINGDDDTETDFGANLFGGVRLPGPSSHWFLEGRYMATDLPQFSILGGVTFHR